MNKRTVLRTALDKLFDNSLLDTVASFVNFCNDNSFYKPEKLKFLKNLPLNNIKEEQFERPMLFKVTK